MLLLVLLLVLLVLLLLFLLVLLLLFVVHVSQVEDRQLGPNPCFDAVWLKLRSGVLLLSR